MHRRHNVCFSLCQQPDGSLGQQEFIHCSSFLNIARLSIMLIVMLGLLPFISQVAHAQSARAVAPTDTLTVDASGNLGAPSYRASGFLHPFSLDSTQPSDSLVTPLKPQVIRYDAGPSAPKGPQGCPWGVTPSYGQRVKNLGIAHQELLVSDQWCNPSNNSSLVLPGDNGDFSTWQNFCTSLAQWEQQQGLNPEYDIWNEPNDGWEWTRSESQWQQTWKVCYQAIRAVNPNAVIVGPSTDGLPGFFNDFVTFAQQNNVVPNYFTWHHLYGGDPYNDVQNVKSTLASAGVSYQGLIINEMDYSPFSVSGESAGGLAWNLARIDRSGIAGASHACTPCNDGTLDSALVNGNTSGGYWVYHRYADITGQLLPVTAGSSIDGVAGADSNTQQVRVLVGTNGETGSMLIRLTNLNSTPYVVNNGQTSVTVEDIPKTDNLSNPNIVQSGNVAVSNNEADITINWGSANDAYNIILSSPGSSTSGGSYQASTGFSSTQGQNQWNYQYSTDGEQSFQNMSWDSTNNAWIGPNGYADYCNVYSNFQHPGNSNCDSARVWQAPSSGTVVLGANGNLSVTASCSSNPGVNIRILKNGTQIWPASGWQAIAHGASYTFPSGVSTDVAAGDRIQFVEAHVGSDNYCDSTTWDQTVSYGSQASTGFSSTQGLYGWSYQQSTDGEQSFQNMSWDSGNNRWQGTEQYCLIGSGWQHPGESGCDSVRVWTASSSHTVSLSSNGPVTVAASCSGNTSGVNIRILKNGTQIWPSSGWQNIANGGSFDFPSGVTASVSSGDQLQFVVAHAGSVNYCDTTTWDQTVS